VKSEDSLSLSPNSLAGLRSFYSPAIWGARMRQNPLKIADKSALISSLLRALPKIFRGALPLFLSCFLGCFLLSHPSPSKRNSLCDIIAAW